VTDARTEAKLVAFESHSRTATVAEPASRQLVTHDLCGNWQARGQAFDDDHE
jgi:hypothetical protein